MMRWKVCRTTSNEEQGRVVVNQVVELICTRVCWICLLNEGNGAEEAEDEEDGSVYGSLRM